MWSKVLSATLLLLLGTAALPAQVPTDGLVAFWNFEGNAIDQTGNGHDGTVVGSSPVPDRFRRPGRAYAFDGIGDVITINAGRALRFGIGDRYSISLWFRNCGESSRGKWRYIMGRNDSDPVSNVTTYYLAMERFWATIEAQASGQGIQTPRPARYDDMLWHHLVLVVADTARSPSDASVRRRFLYLDGQLVAENLNPGLSQAHGVQGKNGAFTIGSPTDRSIFSTFEGAIDDIRIYDRTLSPSEVTLLYSENNWPASRPDTAIGLLFRPLADTVICLGDGVPLRRVSTADTLIWNTTEGIDDPSSETPIARPDRTTTYTITAKRTVGTEPCRLEKELTGSVTIVVRSRPTITIPDTVRACIGEEVLLGGTTSGGRAPYTWRWSPVNGLDDLTLERPTLRVTGDATYRVIVTDFNGCSDTAETVLRARPAPAASAGPDIQICPGLPERIGDPSNDPTLLYVWSPSTGLDDAFAASPIASPSVRTTYTLVAFDQATGCRLYDTVVVAPFDGDLQLSTDALDFGSLNGCTVDTTLALTMTNNGEDSVGIESIRLPDDIDLVASQDTVAPGETATLELRYRPAGTGTLAEEGIIIYGPCNDTLRITLDGAKRGLTFTLPDTIDFGEICLGRSATRSFDITLQSEGTGNGSVVGISLPGPFTTDLTPGEELQDGAPATYTITLTPTGKGAVTEVMTLRLEPCGVERTILLRATTVDVEVGSAPLDFGKQQVGSRTSGLVTWTNTGTTRLRITRLDEGTLFAPAFRVIATNRSLPVDLEPGESLEVEVEYTARNEVNLSSLGLVVEGTCDTVVATEVRGSGDLERFVRLRLPFLSAEPGERVELTLHADSIVGLPSGTMTWNAEIAFNRTLLTTADNTSSRFESERRVLEIAGSWDPATTPDRILARIPLTALLGEMEVTTLELTSFTMESPLGAVTTAKIDGQVTLEGLCLIGGTRLITQSDGGVAIRTVAPTPVRDGVRIDYHLIESGRHTLYLIDSRGAHTLTLFEGLMLPGTYTLTNALKKVPNGTYRLVLETPTTAVSHGIVVGR